MGWVAGTTAAVFGERAMQFVHYVHNSFGFPTCELRYGRKNRLERPSRGSQADEGGGGGGRADRVPRKVCCGDVMWAYNSCSYFHRTAKHAIQRMLSLWLV